MQIWNQGQKVNKMPSALFNINFGASISLSFIAWHVPCDVSVLQCCHSWHSSLERTNRTPQNGTKTAKQDNIPEASFNKKYSAGFYTVGSTWKETYDIHRAERNKHVMFLNVFNGLLPVMDVKICFVLIFAGVFLNLLHLLQTAAPQMVT